MMPVRPLPLAALLAFTAAPLWAQDAPSAYGCSGLSDDVTTPVLEGEDGVFYRIFVDLRMYHPFSDTTMDLMAELSEQLALHGTTLVFLPVPPKSLAMPEELSEEAALYGYDGAIAEEVYAKIISDLTDRGVVAIDGMTALRDGSSATVDTPPFYRTDFHWTHEGARRTAEAMAATFADLNLYDGLTPGTYETNVTGETLAFSGLRRQIQKKCRETVPDTVSLTFATDRVEDGAAGGGAVDLFGGDAQTDVALVGTSFSDIEESNFDGWIKQYTGLEVVNFSVTGGNQYGSMLSYLTSDDFRADRPRILIWENPLYNNLMQFGDQPLRELIAAASETCQTELAVERVGDTALRADLSGLDADSSVTIHAFAGVFTARKATFRVDLADGMTRARKLERPDRLRSTGNFYMSMNAFGDADLSAVTVEFDRRVPEGASLSLCKIENSKESL